MRTTGAVMEDAETLFAFLSDVEDTVGTADIVLAMGSQDLHVPYIAGKAFFERQAQWLICSGGFGKDTSFLFHEPEAVLYAERCIKLGVPEECILLEQASTNSGENFRFSKTLLEQRGIFPKTGVIATKPYMAKRAWATGTKQWPEVRWSVAKTQVRLIEYLEQGNPFKTVLNLMVGDLQRLRVYAGKFQEPVAVPESIWAIYERLVADGYDQHVIPSSPSFS